MEIKTTTFELTMASAHASVVVGDGDEVVDGGTVVLVDHVLAHVEPVNRELDHSVKLVPPVSVVGKPLQRDDEQTGQGPKVKLLRGLLMLLAVGAVPWGGKKVSMTFDPGFWQVG